MKTIDVMEGDRFERIQVTIYQYRDGKCRGIGEQEVDEWWDDVDTDDEYVIDLSVAVKSFLSWGYTLTPAAKPEAKPADVPTCAVHLRGDAHLSAVIGRVNGIADWMYALESRLAAEKPADKDAARVVKAPGRPVYGDGDWRKGVEWEAKRWVAALKDAGITVEAAE